MLGPWHLPRIDITAEKSPKYKYQPWQNACSAYSETQASDSFGVVCSVASHFQTTKIGTRAEASNLSS